MSRATSASLVVLIAIVCFAAGAAAPRALTAEQVRELVRKELADGIETKHVYIQDAEGNIAILIEGMPGGGGQVSSIYKDNSISMRVDKVGARLLLKDDRGQTASFSCNHELAGIVCKSGESELNAIAIAERAGVVVKHGGNRNELSAGK